MAVEPIAAVEQLVLGRDGSTSTLADGLAAGFKALAPDAGGSALPSRKAVTAGLTPPPASAAEFVSDPINSVLLTLQRTIAELIVNVPAADRAERGLRARQSAPATREIERRYSGGDDGLGIVSKGPADTLSTHAVSDSASPHLAKQAAGENPAQVSLSGHHENAAPGVCVLVYLRNGSAPEILEIRVESNQDEHSHSSHSAGSSSVVRFEIDAHPLGTVGILLASTGSRISASFSAGHPAMAAALSEHRDELGASLQAAGLALAELTVQDVLPSKDGNMAVTSV